MKNNVLTDEKLKNAGFSLVELLVVLAIISILAGVGAISWSILKGADVSKASQSVVSCYEKLKTTTMSKTGDWTMKVTRNDKEMYYAGLYDGASSYGGNTELGKYIEIYFKDEKDASATKITKEVPLTVRVKASTGSVSEVICGSTVKYDSAEASDSAYGTIEIWLSGKKSKEVKIYYATGKAVKG